jgi:hypothetical protein
VYQLVAVNELDPELRRHFDSAALRAACNIHVRFCLWVLSIYINRDHRTIWSMDFFGF